MSTTSTRTKSSTPALDVITASLVARQSRTDDGSMSVPDQVDTMRAWCANQTPPVRVGAVYEEPDVSGRRPLSKRKGLRQAVEDIEQGRSQMVLTAYFDRFCCSVATRAEVVQRVERVGGAVMTLDMGRTSNATAADKLSGTMLAAVAEFYADQIGEKTIVSKQRNIDRGVPPFPRITPAYVRRPDGTLEQHPVFGPLIGEAVRMRLGGSSYRQIRDFLAERGLVLSLESLHSTFRSPLLMGEIRFGSFEPNPNAIADPVLDRATFRRLQESKAPRGRYGKSERLLARLGLLVCGVCGSRMSVRSTTRGERFYSYYVCANTLCGRSSVTADTADELVRDETIRLSKHARGRADLDRELSGARRARDAVAEKLSNAVESLAGLRSERAGRDVLVRLGAELTAAEAEVARLESIVAPELTVTTIDDWGRLTLTERRRAVSSVVRRVVVAPGRGPGRVTVEGRETLAQ
jgi:DNA invertase Pin-like site-specific DNA recombinase